MVRSTMIKVAAAVGIAGMIAATAATPSMARGWHHGGWGRGAAAAGVGFAAGALIGSAAANAAMDGYYGPDRYGYAYEPDSAYPPDYAYVPDYSYGGQSYRYYRPSGPSGNNGYEADY